MRNISCVTYWPCVVIEVDGEEFVEQAQPGQDAAFWGVYVRDSKGMAHHIKDCGTEQNADDLACSLAVALDVELEV